MCSSDLGTLACMKRGAEAVDTDIDEQQKKEDQYTAGITVHRGLPPPVIVKSKLSEQKLPQTIIVIISQNSKCASYPT